MRRILLISLLAFNCVWAADSLDKPDSAQENAKTPPSAPGDGQGLDKNTWMEQFAMDLPNHLCQPSMDFVRCFAIKEDECKIFVGWFTKGCLDNMQNHIPEHIDSNKAKELGALTGRCIHDLYHTFLKSRYQPTEGCTQSSLQEPKPSTIQDPTKPETPE